MVQLLGPQDRLLRVVEREHPGVDVHVRGNEITLTGDAAAVAAARSLVDELLAMTKAGHDLGAVRRRRPRTASSRRRAARARPRCSARRSSRRGDAIIRPKTLGQKAYVDAIEENTIVFGIGPAGTGKTYLAMAKAVQALQRKEVSRIILTRPAVEAGERLGIPPRHPERQDRPVPAPALRRAQRDDGPRDRAEAHGERHDRGRAARVHARPHAERLVRRARRGAEHHARADEDVPHPARLRHAHGRHRRHHADRPAAGRVRAAARDPRAQRASTTSTSPTSRATTSSATRSSAASSTRTPSTTSAASPADASGTRRPSSPTAPSAARPHARPARATTCRSEAAHDDRDQQRVRASPSTRPCSCVSWSTTSPSCTSAPTRMSRSCSSTRARWRRCTCSGWTSPVRPTC